MNQYLDQKDGKWHLTISVDVPRLLIKNKLNFRIYNVTMKSGEIIRDPSFNLSSYIFSVAPSFMGKRVFFSSYFEPKEIEDVVEFKFGFCDERVRWHENTIIAIKNNYFNVEVVKDEKLTEYSKLEENALAIEPQKEIKLDFLKIINDPFSSTIDSVFDIQNIVKLPLEDEKKENSFFVTDVITQESGKKISKKVGRRKK